MKKSLLLILVLFAITSAGFSQMENIEQSITAKEKAIYHAIKNKDMDTFRSMLSANFTGVYSSGIVDLEQEAANVADLNLDSYALSDIRVMQPANNVAIIIYTISMDGSYMDEEFSDTYYATSTWLLEDGEWRGLVHSDMKADSSDDDMEMNNQR